MGPFLSCLDTKKSMDDILTAIYYSYSYIVSYVLLLQKENFTIWLGHIQIALIVDQVGQQV